MNKPLHSYTFHLSLHKCLCVCVCVCLSVCLHACVCRCVCLSILSFLQLELFILFTYILILIFIFTLPWTYYWMRASAVNSFCSVFVCLSVDLYIEKVRFVSNSSYCAMYYCAAVCVQVQVPLLEFHYKFSLSRNSCGHIIACFPLLEWGREKLRRSETFTATVNCVWMWMCVCVCVCVTNETMDWVKWLIEWVTCIRSQSEWNACVPEEWKKAREKREREKRERLDWNAISLDKSCDNSRSLAQSLLVLFCSVCSSDEGNSLSQRSKYFKLCPPVTQPKPGTGETDTKV